MKILVIDDKRDNLISLKAIINDKFQDAILYLATDGPEGIKIANKVDPDVILLDIVMPGMDGFEVCSVLKQDKKTKDIPVVFITALKGDKQSRITSLEVGGEAFLSKPIDESELIAQLNAMTRIKESRNDKKLAALHLEKLVKEKTEEIQKELLRREKAQKELSIREEQLSLSMKAAKAGSWSWNLITNEVIWDDRMQEIFGYKPGTFEGTFESWKRVVHPDDLMQAEQKTLEAVKSGSEYNFEYRLNIEEEANFWRTVSAKALVLSNDKGERVRMVGFCIDVTEEKKVLESLHKSEERYNLAMKASTDGVFDWDLVTNEIYYSPGWKSMLGYTDDELPNDFSIWENLTGPEDVQKSWEMQQELINKQRDRFEVEFKMKHKGGHWIDILSRAEAVFDKDDKAIRIIGTHVDITQRKKNEENIKKSQSLLQQAEEISNQGAWEWDIGKDKWTFTENWLRIHGYQLSGIKREELMTIAYPEDVPRIEKAFQDALNGSARYDLEHRIIRQTDGQVRYVKAVGDFILNDSGNRVKMYGITRDITDKKHTEHLLEEHVAQLKFAQQSAGAGLWDWDMKTNKIVWSPELFKLFGLDPEQTDTSFETWDNCMHPDDKDSAYEKLNISIKDHTQLNNEYRVVHPDGKIIWVNAIGNTSYDEEGNPIRNAGICIDISKRKQIEYELIHVTEKALENEEKYRLLHENAGLGIGYFNPDGTVISFNSIASRNMNGVPKDFAGKSIFDLYPKESADFYFARLQKAAKSDDIEVYEDDVQLPTQKKWFLSTYTRIVNSKSEVLGIQIISQDITNIKESEVELKRAKDKAEESDRLKSAFLANMSHEIRTPMNGILGFISLLNDPNLNTEQTNTYSQIINNSGRRLLNTINDIINISKIEAGEVSISQEETSLSNLLEEVSSFHLPEAIQKGLCLTYETIPTDDQTIVLTDNHKLVGILSNLVKNAIKYTEKGTIHFGYELKNDIIEFYVEDTGIGIPKNRIQAIFNRFEQADIEDKKALEGSGLGLAIAKAYVEMLGGTIGVKSEVGKGSIFLFKIPNIKILEKETEEIPIQLENDTSRVKQLNLLIVEDEDVSSQLLLAYFNDTIDNIIIVKNGEEAIEACKQNPKIDVVLMDIKMPIMDGYTATREIRKFNKELIIIAQTAYALPGDEEKAIRAGCNDYITKPISKDRLINVINNHLK